MDRESVMRAIALTNRLEERAEAVARIVAGVRWIKSAKFVQGTYFKLASCDEDDTEVSYYISGDDEYMSFPTWYLWSDDDYIASWERGQVEERKLAEQERARALEEAERQRIEAKERAEYERLKEKYGDR